MVGKRTALHLCFLTLPLASPALATDSLHHSFANCVGRLAAQLEYEWLVSDERAAQTEQQLKQFRDLLEATTPPTQSDDTFGLRLNAKTAHSAILSRAAFNKNRSDAAWAKRRADAEIAQCRTLLLGG
ncbi:MAG: hypothetical protein WAO69_02550 [Aestuariivita sp.]|uniref:hypothetical protein n=1 Tax=Aestuariivita sp. TaxID=1872407 RepID=UPI003BB1446D